MENINKRENIGSQDSAWKDIIKLHFSLFMQFYFPHIAEEIDFSMPVEFKDKELLSFAAVDKKHLRHADLLIQVSTLKGNPALLYAHVEVQGKKEKDFSKRIFTYAYHIFNSTGELPVTLLVLTDTDPHFYPSFYEINDFGRYLRVEFQVVKILYFKEKIEELEKSGNPFAFVTVAQLEVNEVKKGLWHRGGSTDFRVMELYELKKRLIGKLRFRGFSDKYIKSLLKFLDWMVRLPDKLEKKLTSEIEEVTGGKAMPYVTSWERIARKEGRLEGKQEVLTRLLEKKFKLTDKEKALIADIGDMEKLNIAIDAVVFAVNKDEVLRELI